MHAYDGRSGWEEIEETRQAGVKAGGSDTGKNGTGTQWALTGITDSRS